MVVMLGSAVGTVVAVVAVFGKRFPARTGSGSAGRLKEALALWDMVAVISTVI